MSSSRGSLRLGSWHSRSALGCTCSRLQLLPGYLTSQSGKRVSGAQHEPRST